MSNLFGVFKNKPFLRTRAHSLTALFTAGPLRCQFNTISLFILFVPEGRYPSFLLDVINASLSERLRAALLARKWGTHGNA